MDSGSDAIALLKKAEEEAQAKVESARKDASALIKKANERATMLIEESLSEAASAKEEAFESLRADAQGESKAVLIEAETEAGKLKLRGLDDGAVSKCFDMFLGDCNA